MENHKFNYRWTLKDAIFTKDKGKVFSCFSCGGGQRWDINWQGSMLLDATKSTTV